MTLQKVGMDMFVTVEPEEQKQMLEWMKRAVMATDIGVHMQRRQQLAQLIKDQDLKLDNQQHLYVIHRHPLSCYSGYSNSLQSCS